MIRKIVLIYCTMLVTHFAWSQVPVSQVYLFDLQSLADGHTVVHTPRLLTSFNNAGYNNQPFFKNENELYLTVQIPQEGESDIHLFNLITRTRQRITFTPKSEYSPVVTPDKKYISCVRVDDAASATQRLYKYENKPRGQEISVLPDIKNVGYHTWLDDKTVALFLVATPNQLAIVDIESRDPLIFTSDIGRCLASTDKGHLIYVHKISSEFWYIKEYDPVTQRASIITETVPGSEDFAISADGYFIMGAGSKLFVYKPGVDTSWKEIADLKYFGINAITRLAVNGKNLALVNLSK